MMEAFDPPTSVVRTTLEIENVNVTFNGMSNNIRDDVVEQDSSSSCQPFLCPGDVLEQEEDTHFLSHSNKAMPHQEYQSSPSCSNCSNTLESHTYSKEAGSLRSEYCRHQPNFCSSSCSLENSSAIETVSSSPDASGHLAGKMTTRSKISGPRPDYLASCPTTGSHMRRSYPAEAKVDFSLDCHSEHLHKRSDRFAAHLNCNGQSTECHYETVDLPRVTHSLDKTTSLSSQWCFDDGDLRLPRGLEYGDEIPSLSSQKCYGNESLFLSSRQDYGAEIPSLSNRENYGTEIPSLSRRQGYGAEIPSLSRRQGYGAEIPSLSRRQGYGVEIPSLSRRQGYGTEIPSLSSTEGYGAEIPSVSRRQVYGAEIPLVSSRQGYGAKIPSLSSGQGYGAEIPSLSRRQGYDAEISSLSRKIPSLSSRQGYDDEIPSLSSHRSYRDKVHTGRWCHGARAHSWRINQQDASHGYGYPRDKFVSNPVSNQHVRMVTSKHNVTRPTVPNRAVNNTDNYIINKKDSPLRNSEDIRDQVCGPRADKLNNAAIPSTGKDVSPLVYSDQINRSDFSVQYEHAKFFMIKSYSEDDIHKGVKYNVWASTPNGNNKLDAAFHEAQKLMKEKGTKCHVFLFFSVNTSGQFVGLAEMLGPVDFKKTMDFWNQDKWNGFFPVTWHILKDIPNRLFRHITLENNYNRPVTFSRDTQEIGQPQGLEMLKIFKDYCHETSILDDFKFYEEKEKERCVQKGTNADSLLAARLSFFGIEARLCDDFESMDNLETSMESMSFYENWD